MAAMPPPPLVGRKRAAAGLTDVPLPRCDKRSLEQERAARALVAILPYGCAGFVLQDPDSDFVDSSEPGDVAQAMVDVLAPFGVSSLNAAASALGAFFTWMHCRHPGVQRVHGQHFALYLREVKISRGAATAFKWLRDWCGIDNPSRGAVFRGVGGGSSRSNPKESFSFRVLLGFEEIAATDPSEFVSGSAAALFLLCVAALRCEQASDACLVAVVPHSFRALSGSILVAACARDKNPDPEKASSRPIWAGVTGLRHPGAVESALTRMLARTAEVGCILPDTDSLSGDPRSAGRWMLTPLAPGARTDRLIHSLLTHPAIGMTAEQASRFHGHSPKRFTQNVCKAATSLDDGDAHELGRFSGSSAQNADLVPSEAMLRRHSLQCAVLPDMYARAARVEKCMDRLLRFEDVLRRALARAGGDVSALPLFGGWSSVFDGI